MLYPGARPGGRALPSQSPGGRSPGWAEPTDGEGQGLGPSPVHLGDPDYTSLRRLELGLLLLPVDRVLTTMNSFYVRISSIPKIYKLSFF